MAPRVRWLIVVLVAAGCGVPEGDRGLALSLAPGSQTIDEQLGLAVRPVPGTGEFVVLHGEHELARGPTDAGQVLRFALDGRDYTLEFRGVQVDTDCSPRNDRNPNPRSSDIVCRDSRWLAARLGSPDGPLPGSTPTLRGAAPRRLLYTALPGLLAGVLVAAAVARNIAVGLALALAVLVGGCMLGYHGFDGLFAVTYGLAFLVYAALGLFAGVAWHDNSRAAGLGLLLGGVLGALPVVYAYPLWSEGGPLVAVTAALPGVVIALLLLHGLTALLGEAHPVARWLLASGAAATRSAPARSRKRRARR